MPLTGRGGPYGCEMLRIPHYLNNQLIDGGKVVSPTHQPHFTPQKHYFFFMFPVLISVDSNPTEAWMFVCVLC
jgi:hypothetical protein